MKERLHISPFRTIKNIVKYNVNLNETLNILWQTKIKLPVHTGYRAWLIRLAIGFFQVHEKHAKMAIEVMRWNAYNFSCFTLHFQEIPESSDVPFFFFFPFLFPSIFIESVVNVPEEILF